jgi:RNA polymerase sigma factor (sigma-70 family)
MKEVGMTSKNMRGDRVDRTEMRDCLALFRSVPVLRDRDEFDQLFQQYKEGATLRIRQRAESSILSGNARLVVPIVSDYLGRGVSGGDLFQEGMIGMRRALTKFEVERGFRFSTYATWWIRADISRAIDEKSTLLPFRVPTSSAYKVRRLQWEIARYYLEHYSWPSPEDLARTQLPEGFSEKQLAVQIALIQRLMETSLQSSLSLDASRSEGDSGEEGFTLLSRMSDSRPLPDALLMEKRYTARVRKMLQRLPERTRAIIRCRFGFGGQQAMTLEEIGERFQLTRERIRQIESETLRQLKAALLADQDSFEYL